MFKVRQSRHTVARHQYSRVRGTSISYRQKNYSPVCYVTVRKYQKNVLLKSCPVRIILNLKIRVTKHYSLFMVNFQIFSYIVTTYVSILLHFFKNTITFIGARANRARCQVQHQHFLTENV